MPARLPSVAGMDYDTGFVRSEDGTTIGGRRLGARGPAVILLHGGMQAAQNLMRLARFLAADFSVCVVDRRGRGLSGPHGRRYSVEREVEDVQALVAQTGATRIFGLSSGGLVALRSALRTPALERVAVYEPPLSIDGSVNVGWVDRFDREIAGGHSASALVTALKGIGTEPVFARVPRFALVPVFAAGTRLQRMAPAGDVPIVDLVPTHRYDMRIVEELAGTLPEYAAVQSNVLLLGGAKSPAFLRTALDGLERTLPHARRIEFPGLGHSGPDDDGKPERVGTALREFFSA
jgi:pimeloyl-ACP methyl ester carboxylesterase